MNFKVVFCSFQPHVGVRDLRYNHGYQRDEQEMKLIGSCRCHDNYCLDTRCRVTVPVRQVPGAVTLRPSIVSFICIHVQSFI